MSIARPWRGATTAGGTLSLVSVAAPAPVSTNPLRRLAGDILTERAFDGPLPPGPTKFSLSRTRAFARDPLPMLLDAYERYGPIFTLRILHANGVFMLGPEANHYMTVSHAANFRWREGGLGDLIPLLGDGLLTIDGDYHRRARRIMLPAFHRERIAAAADVDARGGRARDRRRGRAGRRARPLRLDARAWRCASRMRALFGFDPDARRARRRPGRGVRARARLLRPRLPAADPARPAHAVVDACSARGGASTALIYAEIARRRRAAGRERGEDILSLLLDARDEDGSQLSDQQMRDQVMTLLFAGHDTTTSTVTFMFYELARHPRGASGAARRSSTGVRRRRAPTAAQLTCGELPEQLEMVHRRDAAPVPAGLDRAAPRRRGVRVRRPRACPPARSSTTARGPATTCPTCSTSPRRSGPSASRPEAKAALPKGAYVPFGGGSRTCIGMRFGQLEIRAIAATILRRFTLELQPGYELRIRQMPTLSPRGGLPVTVRAR